MSMCRGGATDASSLPSVPFVRAAAASSLRRNGFLMMGMVVDYNGCVADSEDVDKITRLAPASIYSYLKKRGGTREMRCGAVWCCVYVVLIDASAEGCVVRQQSRDEVESKQETTQLWHMQGSGKGVGLVCGRKVNDGIDGLISFGDWARTGAVHTTSAPLGPTSLGVLPGTPARPRLCGVALVVCRSRTLSSVSRHTWSDATRPFASCTA